MSSCVELRVGGAVSGAYFQGKEAAEEYLLPATSRGCQGPIVTTIFKYRGPNRREMCLDRASWLRSLPYFRGQDLQSSPDDVIASTAFQIICILSCATKGIKRSTVVFGHDMIEKAGEDIDLLQQLL
jgi:hypothetical protein